MYSQNKRDEAIKLRKEGNSYDYISSKISVAKSTLSEWLKEIAYIPNELMVENRSRNINNIISVKRVDKVASLQRARKYAKEKVGELTERDIFMFGLGIYQGEGSKTANITRVVNSDPRIIKFTMVWLKQNFALYNENFRVRLHIYPDNSEEQVIKFWMKSLGMERKFFQPSYVDARLDKKKNRAGVLPYGTAHLTVMSHGNKELGVLLQRKIIASMDFVLNQDMRD